MVEHSVGEVPLVTTVTSTISGFLVGVNTSAGGKSISFDGTSLAGERSALDFDDRSSFSVCRFIMRTLESLAVIYEMAGLEEIPRPLLARTPNLFPYDGLLEYNLLYVEGP